MEQHLGFVENEEKEKLPINFFDGQTCTPVKLPYSISQI